MLGVLCARPKPWILNSLISHFHGSPSSHNSRLVPSHPSSVTSSPDSTVAPRHHSANSSSLVVSNGGAACIWRVIHPCHQKRRKRKGCSRINSVRRRLLPEPKGEGSWNAAWDARPARWLHRPDSAWLLFGAPAYQLPIESWTGDATNEGDNTEGRVDVLDFIYEILRSSSHNDDSDLKHDGSSNYKVTGVLADGRCLFRAIVHGMCLRSGEEAPDENRQRELADELRAQVVDELLKRREETEWFIEGDFDAYVKRIQQPYVWGGEPELLMASHVLKTVIYVFMIDRTSSKLVNIANYGEEYQKDEVNPINLLFHGYGHYELLETSDQTYLKVKVQKLGIANIIIICFKATQ